MLTSIIRSIPLSSAVRQAWRDSGAKLISRKNLEDSEATLRAIEKLGTDVVINLGRTDDSAQVCVDAGLTVFNPPSLVRHISHPLALRRNLNEFIPPRPAGGQPYWLKRGGFGGVGTSFHKAWTHDHHYDLMGGDVQVHIVGDQYRIISVGDTVVQAFRKEGEYDGIGKHEFAFHWVGVDGIRNGGFIPLIKGAVNTLPDRDRSIIGWDVIVDSRTNRPYILEANFSPGVNANTAERIISIVKRSGTENG